MCEYHIKNSSPNGGMYLNRITLVHSKIEDFFCGYLSGYSLSRTLCGTDKQFSVILTNYRLNSRVMFKNSRTR